jgi:hypothetical protein
MAKGTDNSRSFLRLLLWEGAALAGLLHLQMHPLASPLWSLNFFYNALFFLVAYPLLYVYRWKVSEGCLNLILWPLSFVLSWGLGVSTYLWMAYWFNFTGNPFSAAMRNHEIVLGILFAVIYFALIQPVLGTSQRYQSLGQLLWVFLYSALGGFLCFLLGQFVVHKWGDSMTSGNQFLLWLGLILLGTAVGSLIAQRRSKG